MTEKEQALIRAVLYAVRNGCFFPVRKPKRTWDVRAWIKWGAMVNLHQKIAEYSRPATETKP